MRLIEHAPPSEEPTRLVFVGVHGHSFSRDLRKLARLKTFVLVVPVPASRGERLRSSSSAEIFAQYTPNPTRLDANY